MILVLTVLNNNYYAFTTGILTPKSPELKGFAYCLELTQL